MVRKERLELSRVTPLEPKSSASANSATFAPQLDRIQGVRVKTVELTGGADLLLRIFTLTPNILPVIIHQPGFLTRPLVTTGFLLLLSGWQDNGKIYSETFLGERCTGPHALLGYYVRGRADHDTLLPPLGTNGHTAAALAIFLKRSRKLQAGRFGAGLNFAVFIIQREYQRSRS